MARAPYGGGGYGGFAPYVPQHERRRRAAAAMARRAAAGQAVAPVTGVGRTIATTFWGRAWCTNLERYHDFANRLPRGRTYVRNGSVVHLEAEPGRVAAVVSGSALYDVAVEVARLPQATWRSICADCVGGIDSLVELLRGGLDAAVMARVTRPHDGLFPHPKEIRFSCSCPDAASMCKHVAAVLYGVGARLDHDPALLFRLRAVSPDELVARAAEDAVRTPAKGAGRRRRLDDADVAAVFGVDLSGGAATSPPAPPPAPRRPKEEAPRPRAARKASARRDATTGDAARAAGPEPRPGAARKRRTRRRT